MSSVSPPSENRGNQPHWPASTAQPKAAYIHIPFCRAHCGYCNFSVLAGRDDLGPTFLEALHRELESTVISPPLESIFIGGGTPTHLGASWLDDCLTVLEKHLPRSAHCEVTVESNPLDLAADVLTVLAAHQVNRLSLGVQSFNDQKLRILERDHTAAEASQAIERAAKLLPQISIDLIFGAPGETLSTWRSDLTCATSLPLTHVSTYGLTYEKGAAFYGRLQRGMLKQLPEEDELTLYQTAREHFQGPRWEQYEISNFAVRGFRCRHNQSYWHGRGWYAFGPGAARYIAGVREVNHRSTTTYIKRMMSAVSPVAERECLTIHEAFRERIAFGLRMLDGVELVELVDEFGESQLAIFWPILERLKEMGCLEISESRIRLTDYGIPISDAVLSEILSVAAPK